MQNKKVFVGYIILVIIAAVTSVAGLYIGKRINNQVGPTPTVSVSQYPDFELVKTIGDDHTIVIINKSDFRDPNQPNTAGNTSGWISSRGQLARAYLFIEASVNDKPLSSFESIFVKMNYVGGHLVLMNSLPVPTFPTATQLLYGLNDINYKRRPTDASPTLNTDWFYQLNTKHKISFAAFLASQIDGRVTVKLYYQCTLTSSDCSVSFTPGRI